MRRILLTFSALSAIALVAGISPHAASAAQEIAVVASDVLTADQKVFISKKGAEVVEHITAAKKLTAGTTNAMNAKREAGRPSRSARHREGETRHARSTTRSTTLTTDARQDQASGRTLLPVDRRARRGGEGKGLGVEELAFH